MTTQVQDHLKKTKAKPVKASSALTDAQRQLVDRAAVLKAEIDAIKPAVDEFEDIRKQLLAVADLHYGPDDQAKLEGDEHTIIFSKKSDTRVINDMNGLIGKLKSVMGYEGLLKLLKIGVGDVDKHLSPDEAAKFIDHVPGSRSFKGYT